MTDRTPSRRPGSASRTPTSRPRRIAGTGPIPQSDVDESESSYPEEATFLEEPEEPKEPEEPDEERVEPAVVAAAPERRKMTVLIAVIVLLLGVGTWELISILGHESPGDRPARAVTAEQPVQVDVLTVRSVVDQAGQASVAIGSASWENYEAGIDTAAAMMTDAFAETYRETKSDVKDQVVDQKVDVTVQVDAQDVVRADPDEIVALVFLTQSTIAGTGPVTPRQYRATVTMVRTGDGWLVADLDAGALLDITGDDG